MVELEDVSLNGGAEDSSSGDNMRLREDPWWLIEREGEYFWRDSWPKPDTLWSSGYPGMCTDISKAQLEDGPQVTNMPFRTSSGLEVSVAELV